MKRNAKFNMDKFNMDKINMAKIREKTLRTSLTIMLSVFVFSILFFAITLTALGLWLLTLAGVTVDIYGDLQLGLIILFMFLISLIIGGVLTYFSSRIPLKPVNELINKMNSLAAGDFHTRLVGLQQYGQHPSA